MKLTGIQSAQLADNELANVDGLAELHLLSSLNLSVRFLLFSKVLVPVEYAVPHVISC